MTQEDKAKAYDEAYKRATIRFGSNVADELFLELKENEDERIRKFLIEDIKDTLSSESFRNYNPEHTDKLKESLDWLEKQSVDNKTNTVVNGVDVSELTWINMETNECHCYNCELFDSKNNKCKNIKLCKNPKRTYKGFYIR